MTEPSAVIVMGVSGSGKSVVGNAVAEAFGWPLLEGDDFHPESNVAKMASGTPLNDDDRWPWLDAIAEAIRTSDTGVFVTCSALRRVYRDRLRAGAGRPVVFLFLDGSRETLAERIGARKDHFMPPALLDSQLATLEPPDPDEDVVRVSVEPPVAEVAAAAIEGLAKKDIRP